MSPAKMNMTGGNLLMCCQQWCVPGEVQVADMAHQALLDGRVGRVPEGALGSPHIPRQEGDVFKVQAHPFMVVKSKLLPLL